MSSYEEYFSVISMHCPDNDYNQWIEYFIKRYIVNLKFFQYCLPTHTQSRKLF